MKQTKTGYVADIQDPSQMPQKEFGGKAYSLVDISKNVDLGIMQVPHSLAISSQAYSYFISENRLGEKIKAYLNHIDKNSNSSIQKASLKIKKIIMESKIPVDLAYDIISNYQNQLREKAIAVRSSCTQEDMDENSYAGMYDSYLGVLGVNQVLEAVKKCYASMFNARALAYMLKKGQTFNDLSMAVILQEMVNTNKSYSGVVFTYSKEYSTEKVIVIDASYGLGEGIVQGKIEPDEYIVFKQKMDGYTPIIDKHIGSKKYMVIYRSGALKLRATSSKQRNSFVLSNDEIMILSNVAKKLEDHYRCPIDVEWAKDGINERLYLLQARPITFKKKEDNLSLKNFKLGKKGEPILKGLAVGDTIGNGTVKIIKNIHDSAGFNEGEVLVTKMTNPDWLHVIMKASAIVTDEGGRTSHPAIICRELGKPCIVGTKNATSKLYNGQEVTVSCVEGPEGMVYDGRIKCKVIETRPKLPKTKTKVLMNINLSDMSFRYATYPSDGVGMIREEFIINERVGIHPLALINYELLKKDPKHKQLVKLIEEKTRGYKYPSFFYVERLAQALGKIAAAFYPREVIVKLTDFKSSEYRNVPGGILYEPHEDNPLIGWRSAVRFYSPEYGPAFKLECEALRQVREVMGLENIHPMIPFCRTPEEGKVVLETLAKYGIPQGRNGMKVIAEVEVPTSIILMDQYAALFDGFQIGSNCLTQSILCLDRNSHLTSHLFNENHPAMRAVIREAIKKAHKYGKKIGIVGQAPSDIPEFTEFLIEEGIDSISLNPDPQTFIKIKQKIAKKERNER